VRSNTHSPADLTVLTLPHPCVSSAAAALTALAVHSRHYNEADTSLTDRADKLEAVAELIEKDMELLGATAIEDKLQVRRLRCALLARCHR
jgi:hypothetical protein